MAKQIQFRGGTTAQHSVFTGAIREITVDTDKDTLVVHDGTTVGGFPLARESIVTSGLATKVDKNANIVAGTGTKVTYDSKGLVTSSTTPTTIAGYSIADAYTKTEVDNKISTDGATVDNTVPRYDGVSGKLQSSGVVISDNNNVGIGVTPSAWTIGKAIDIGNSGALFGDGINNTWDCGIVQNGYQYTVNGWKYKASQYAAMYRIKGSEHIWTIAPVGTAGTTISWTNAMTLDYSGNLTLNSGTGALGYGTGAGGTVTQLTSKETTVTLNKPTGRIIMSNAALGASASSSFLLNNILAGANDTCMVQIVNTISNDLLNYKLEVSTYSIQGFYITLTNKSGSTLSEAIQIQFTIIKGASA